MLHGNSVLNVQIQNIIHMDVGCQAVTASYILAYSSIQNKKCSLEERVMFMIWSTPFPQHRGHNWVPENSSSLHEVCNTLQNSSNTSVDEKARAVL